MLASQSNKVLNKVSRTKPLWLFWCIYFSHRKYYCYKNYAANPNANLAVEKKVKQPIVAATQVTFKYCTPFKDCRTKINNNFVDSADFMNITVPMYDLIDYSINDSDSSGSLVVLKEMR